MFSTVLSCRRLFRLRRLRFALNFKSAFTLSFSGNSPPGWISSHLLNQALLSSLICIRNKKFWGIYRRRRVSQLPFPGLLCINSSHFLSGYLMVERIVVYFKQRTKTVLLVFANLLYTITAHSPLSNQCHHLTEQINHVFVHNTSYK